MTEATEKSQPRRHGATELFVFFSKEICSVSLRLGDWLFAASSQTSAVSYVVSAWRQKATHFFTSATASEPSGTLYSSSIDPGIFHLFFLTS